MQWAFEEVAKRVVGGNTDSASGCDDTSFPHRSSIVLCPILSTSRRSVVAYDLRHSSKECVDNSFRASARFLLEIASKIVSSANHNAHEVPPILVRLTEPDLGDDLLPIAAERMAEQNKSISGYLGFDICEKDMVENRSRSIAMLDRLRKAGFQISLRGFGSFGASLSNLVDIGVDYVRLNHVVLENVADDSRLESIAKSVVEMIQMVGASIVASDLEIATELRFAEEIGCTHFTSSKRAHEICIDSLINSFATAARSAHGRLVN